MEKIEQMKFKDFEKLQKDWMKTFELKDINQDFIPNLPKELKDYFKQDIHLRLGSLLKLIDKNRIEMLGGFHIIKETLENPDALIKDKDCFLFIKAVDKNRLIFTSVSKSIEDEMMVSSNHFKKATTLINIMVDRGGELIYERKKGLLIDIIDEKLKNITNSFETLKNKLQSNKKEVRGRKK